MIPVLGFATLSRFDMAQRLLDSIDHPVEHLVIVDNSGKKEFEPVVPDCVENTWLIRVPYGLGANGAWNLIIKSTPYAPYWVLPNDDSYFAPGALHAIAHGVKPGAFNFVDVKPSWSCVVPTEGAVEAAGLWDEIFYPIYFDDDDYERRLKHFNVPFHTINAKVYHDNSSTLKSGYEAANHRTFQRNQSIHLNKSVSEDFGIWGWQLKTRRENRWD